MKAIRCLLILACLLPLGHLSAQKESKARRQAKVAQMVKDSVEARTYRIDVHTALPMSGRNVPLSAYFYLRIKNDSVDSYLPYFGRAYSIPYGGGDGLDFEAPIQNYKQKDGKKGAYAVTFNARTHEDYYTYRIDIYPNGTASVSVRMNQRQGIDFLGDLTLQTVP